MLHLLIFWTKAFASLAEKKNTIDKYTTQCDIHSVKSFELFSPHTQDVFDRILKHHGEKNHLTVDEVFTLISQGLTSYFEYKIFVISAIDQFFKFESKVQEKLFLKYFEVFKNEFLQSEDKTETKLQNSIAETTQLCDFTRIDTIRENIWQVLTDSPIYYDKVYRSRHFEAFYDEICYFIGKTFDIHIDVLSDSFEIKFSQIRSIEDNKSDNSVQNDQHRSFNKIYVKFGPRKPKNSIKIRLIELFGYLTNEDFVFTLPNNFFYDLEDLNGMPEFCANMNFFTCDLLKNFSISFSNLIFKFNNQGQIVESNYLDQLFTCFHSTFFASYDFRNKIKIILPVFSAFLQKSFQFKRETNFLHHLVTIFEYIVRTVAETETLDLSKNLLIYSVQRFHEKFNQAFTQSRMFDIYIGDLKVICFTLPRNNRLFNFFYKNSDCFLFLSADYLFFASVPRLRRSEGIEKYFSFFHDAKFDGTEPKNINMIISFREYCTYRVQIFNSIFCECRSVYEYRKIFKLDAEIPKDSNEQKIIRFIVAFSTIWLEKDVYLYETEFHFSNCYITAKGDRDLFCKSLSNSFESCVIEWDVCKINIEIRIVSKVSKISFLDCDFRKHLNILQAPTIFIWADNSRKMFSFLFMGISIMSRLNSDINPRLERYEGRSITMFSIVLNGCWEIAQTVQSIQVKNVYFHMKELSLRKSHAFKQIMSRNFEKGGFFSYFLRNKFGKERSKLLTKNYTIDCRSLNILEIDESIGTLYIKNLRDIPDFYLTLFTDSVVSVTPTESKFHKALVSGPFCRKSFFVNGDIDDLKRLINHEAHNN